jgi:hypothetical protein
MNKPAALVLALGIMFAAITAATAQEQPTQQPTPTAEEQEKQKSELDKKAYRLLDQVIDEAQSLKLVENRVRVQINAADLLWDHNQARARSLFSLAAEGVTEMMRTPDNSNRPNANQSRRPGASRQELVLTAARHDAPLAYQLLAATRPAVTPPAVVDPRNPRQIISEENLEQNLLAQVSALDPKLAGQNAEQMLEKGQFPRSLTEVIAQLQRKDEEAATKLTDKMLKLLQSTNMLANTEAGTLALGLLGPGPRLPASNSSGNEDTPKVQPQAPYQVLNQSAYNDLMGTVIDAALKATPQAGINQRGLNNQRGRGPNGSGQVNVQTDLTDAQIEQINARRLLSGLQTVLPQIDQYLPSRAQSVRQKMTEVGMDNSRVSFSQTLNSLQQANQDTDGLMQVASTAPPMLQPRLYEQAALKALDEGNTDRARQIATEHLDVRTRDVVLQRIDFRELSKKAENTRLDEIRQNLSRLHSDSERVDLLIQMTTDLQQSNPKLARQLLEEARQITNRRASNYDQFEQQLKVAHAFASIEPARSFEVLDPGIGQINELLSAAALLSGFEVNIFREGELPLQSGSGLSNMVTRYGQELALLAKSDFERSETLAGRFQLSEPRILARLTIVQSLLGVQPVQPNNVMPRGFGQNFSFMRSQ